MKLEIGKVYKATIGTGWFKGDLGIMPKFFIVDIEKDRVKYKYVDDTESTSYYRWVDSFMLCNPVEMSELEQLLY